MAPLCPLSEGAPTSPFHKPAVWRCLWAPRPQQGRVSKPTVGPSDCSLLRGAEGSPSPKGMTLLGRCFRPTWGFLWLQILALFLLGTFPETFCPVCPVKSWNAGNTDDCSFFSLRLFPFAEVVPGDGRPFLFGQLGGGSPPHPRGLCRAWLTHRLCCGAGCQLFPHCCPARTESGSAACWAHLASFHKRIQPPAGGLPGARVLSEAGRGRASSAGAASCPLLSLCSPFRGHLEAGEGEGVCGVEIRWPFSFSVENTRA